MEIKKVTEFKELDDIVPLVQKLKEPSLSKGYFSLIGFISWLAINFPLKNFQVWKAVDANGKVHGYLIAQIVQRYLVPECHIVDAFIDENNEEVTQAVYNHIENWARENKCRFLSINTAREKSFARKYGFSFLESAMIKEI